MTLQVLQKQNDVRNHQLNELMAEEEKKLGEDVRRKKKVLTLVL